MIKKTIILLVSYFLQFYLTSLRGKEYFAKFNQESGGGAGRSRVFLAPSSRRRSHLKKNRSRSWSRLGKKSGAGAGAA